MPQSWPPYHAPPRMSPKRLNEHKIAVCPRECLSHIRDNDDRKTPMTAQSNFIPLSLCVLLSGLNPEADQGMATGFEQAVLGPVLGGLQPEERLQLLGGEGPRLVILLMPGRPELNPAVHLLNTALAAAFFRAVGLASGE